MASKWRNREDGGWERDVTGGVLVIEKTKTCYMGQVIEPDSNQEARYPFFREFSLDEKNETAMKRECMQLCNEYNPPEISAQKAVASAPLV